MQPEFDAMVYENGDCFFDKKSKVKLSTAADRARVFAQFGSHKFKSLKGDLHSLPALPGSVEDRAHDIPSDNELSVCLAAMSSGKAPGHDGAYSDIYKRVPTCKALLFDLVRAIWREEHYNHDTWHICNVIQEQG